MAEWKYSDAPIDYLTAYNEMQERRRQVIAGEASGLVWFLEHPSVITCGRSTEANELLTAQKSQIIEIERGGRSTYHNPGQRVVYFVLDLKEVHEGNPDIRCFIADIEQAVIRTLEHFMVKAYVHPGQIGVYVGENPIRKIASIGLNVRRWVTAHGVAINVANDLNGFAQIIPCGLNDITMTSLSQERGQEIGLVEFDKVLVTNLKNIT